MVFLLMPEEAWGDSLLKLEAHLRKSQHFTFGFKDEKEVGALPRTGSGKI